MATGQLKALQILHLVPFCLFFQTLHSCPTGIKLPVAVLSQPSVYIPWILCLLNMVQDTWLLFSLLASPRGTLEVLMPFLRASTDTVRLGLRGLVKLGVKIRSIGVRRGRDRPLTQGMRQRRTELPHTQRQVAHLFPVFTLFGVQVLFLRTATLPAWRVCHSLFLYLFLRCGSSFEQKGTKFLYTEVLGRKETS